MSLLRPNFSELYERHLCRHSQFGINVQHLVGVTVTYLCLCGLIRAAAGSTWPLVVCSLVYLAVTISNTPLRIALVTVAFVAVLSVIFVALPSLVWWIYVIVILLAYKIQAWTHRYWDVAYDTTEFDKKYRKGFGLFVLLSIYELPILLAYLLFWGARKETYAKTDHSAMEDGRTLTLEGEGARGVLKRGLT
jgi:hypothetical protein